MNTSQKNSQTMGESVITVLDDYHATWSGSDTTAEAAAQHGSNLDNIRTWQLQQEEAAMLAGLVQEKNLLRKSIKDKLIHFIGSICAWANGQGKLQIVTLISNSPSKLQTATETDFITMAQTLHDIASANALAIQPFGVSAAMITGLQTDINAFMDYMGQVKGKKSKFKTASRELKLAIRFMISYLKNHLDNNVKQFIDTPFFYAYLQSRRTFNNNNRTTSVKGTVITSDGHKLHNALVSIISLDADRSVLTNKQGNYKMKNLDLDSCILRVTAPNCIPAEFDLSLKRGFTTDFDVVMHKIVEIPVPVPSPLA